MKHLLRPVLHRRILLRLSVIVWMLLSFGIIPNNTAFAKKAEDEAISSKER